MTRTITMLLITTLSFASVAAEEVAPVTAPVAGPAAPVAPVAVPAPAAAPMPVALQAPKALRERKHHIEYRISSTNTDTSAKSGNAASTNTSNESTGINVSYGYQIHPQFQPFISYSLAFKGADTSWSDAGGISIGAIGQLVENRAGNNFIPFGMMSISSLSLDLGAGTTTSKMIGNATSIGVGADFYPFGELVALRFAYQIVKGSLSGRAGIVGVSADIDIKGLMSGLVISF